VNQTPSPDLVEILGLLNEYDEVCSWATGTVPGTWAEQCDRANIPKIAETLEEAIKEATRRGHCPDLTELLATVMGIKKTAANLSSRSPGLRSREEKRAVLWSKIDRLREQRDQLAAALVVAESQTVPKAVAESTLTSDLPPKKTRRMTAKQANTKAMELARKDRSFVSRSLREWSKAIGCSVGLVVKLPLWKATMTRYGRGQEDKLPAPKALSLTSNLEATLREAELEELIADHNADFEPSVLDDDPPESQPRKVYTRTRV
jgi:hypothetical protein